MADREDVSRLSAVVERQRRELARVQAERDAMLVTAMARGVLMERHGWSSAQAARQLVDLAAAAGLPEPEMAAAVLAQEPPSPAPAPTGSPDPEDPRPSARRTPGGRTDHFDQPCNPLPTPVPKLTDTRPELPHNLREFTDQLPTAPEHP